ncbi:MAG: lysophospholipase L1-like esterase [Algoriphagus sp.]|jgi:lysophospholipase L1-like esterase
MSKIDLSYLLFQTRLYPLLPYLAYEAWKIKRSVPNLAAISEHLVLEGKTSELLLIGESTVAGVGATTTAFTLAGHIFNLFKGEYTVSNFGKNGIQIAETLPLFEVELEKNPKSIEGIFIFIGANDCFQWTNPKSFAKSLARLIEKLEQLFHPNWIYLADIPPVQLFPAFSPLMQGYLQRQREFLRNEMKSISVNRNNLVFEEIKLELVENFFAADGIHPSDFGYQLIAEFAFEGIRNHVKEKSPSRNKN